MATITQLLTAAKNQDATIQEIIQCPQDPYSPTAVENYIAVRAGTDQYTKKTEYFQILVKDKGLGTEAAYFIGKCPCEAETPPAPTTFEQWLDDRIATELANDATIEDIIKEYVDNVQERAQLLIVKMEGTSIRKIVAFVYTARDGTHKVQYQNL